MSPRAGKAGGVSGFLEFFSADFEDPADEKHLNTFPPFAAFRFDLLLCAA
jgi:hypothetical protein